MSQKIEVYEHPQRWEDKSEFYFKLMPGFWAHVSFCYSHWTKRFIPNLQITRTDWVPRTQKTFTVTSKRKFNYHVGKTPEEVKGILLRRMQRELRDDLKKAAKAKNTIEIEMASLERLHKRAKKFERSIT